MTAHADDSPQRSAAARPGRPGYRTVGSRLLASVVDSSDDAILSKALDGAQAEIRALNMELEARVELRTAELVAANKNLEAFTC